MGASESKLDFKQGIFRLSDAAPIPADDEYWSKVSLLGTSLLKLT
jgi:High-temperature-induced dauer-formation protein